jgi:hypothetical protein
VSQAQWFYEDNGSRVGPISEETIKALLQDKKIGHNTLVWRPGLDGWIALETSDLQGELAATPPPLRKENISDLWVGFLAGSPLFWMVTPYGYERTVFVVLWLLSIFLCAMEIRKIRLAGYKAPSIWWSFFVPGYLFVRSQKLQVHYVPLIVWLALTFLPADYGYW